MSSEMDWEVATLNGFYIMPIDGKGMNMLHPDFAAKYPDAVPAYYRLQSEDIDWNQYATEEEAKAAAPEYSTDLNVTVSLLDQLPKYKRVEHEGGTWDVEGTNGHVEITNINSIEWWCKIILTGDQNAEYEGADASLPVAICQAYIKWKRAQH